MELAQAVHERTRRQGILLTACFDPARLPGLTDREQLELVEVVNRTVFGRTNRMNELIHLVLINSSGDASGPREG